MAAGQLRLALTALLLGAGAAQGAEANLPPPPPIPLPPAIVISKPPGEAKPAADDGRVITAFVPGDVERPATAQKAAVSDAPPRFRLSASTQLLSSSERQTAQTLSAGMGTQLTFRPLPQVLLVGQAGLALSQQEYRPLLAPPDRPIRSGRETRIDLAIGAEYQLTLLTERYFFAPGLSWKQIFFRNESFPTDYGGPRLTLRGGFDFTPAIRLRADVAVSANLARLTQALTSLSSAGGPLYLVEQGLGFDLPLSDGASLELGYRGETLGLLRDFRVAHGFGVRAHFLF